MKKEMSNNNFLIYKINFSFNFFEKTIFLVIYLKKRKVVVI